MKRCLLLVYAVAMLGALMARVAATGSLPLLATVRQVRELSREEAARGYPVRLRGVITYHEPTWFLSFVQDSTGGIHAGERYHPKKPGRPSPPPSGGCGAGEGRGESKSVTA